MYRDSKTRLLLCYVYRLLTIQITRCVCTPYLLGGAFLFSLIVLSFFVSVLQMALLRFVARSDRSFLSES
jgi:hypothetical protein